MVVVDTRWGPCSMLKMWRRMAWLIGFTALAVRMGLRLKGILHLYRLFDNLNTLSALLRGGIRLICGLLIIIAVNQFNHGHGHCSKIVFRILRAPMHYEFVNTETNTIVNWQCRGRKSPEQKLNVSTVWKIQTTCIYSKCYCNLDQRGNIFYINYFS